MTRASFMVPLAASLIACGAPTADRLPTTGAPPSMVPLPEREPSTMNAESGGRLRARFVAAEGGAQRFLQFVDTETEEPCALRASRDDDDAIAHCLPTQSGWLVFADETCTRQLVQVPESDHVWITASDQNGLTIGVRRGAQVNDLSQVYFEYGRTGCARWGVEPSNTPVYEIAEQRNLRSWPGGRLEVTAPSDQLESTLFRGYYGSWAVWDVIDTRSGTQCRPGETDAGPRCIPTIDSFSHVDEGLRSADCLQQYIAEYSSGAVSRLADVVHRMTGLSHETPVAKLVDGECVLQDSFQLGRKSLYLAEPYPASDWPVVAFERFGEPDLVAELARASEQSVDPLNGQINLALFREPNRNGRCGPAWVDGTLRCIPQPSAAERSYVAPYADPACMVPAVSMRSAEEPPAVVRRLVGRAPPALGALDEVALFEIGRQLTSGGYVRNADGSCSPSPFGGDLYALGARLDATEFAPLRLVD